MSHDNYVILGAHKRKLPKNVYGDNTFFRKYDIGALAP